MLWAYIVYLFHNYIKSYHVDDVFSSVLIKKVHSEMYVHLFCDSYVWWKNYHFDVMREALIGLSSDVWRQLI